MRAYMLAAGILASACSGATQAPEPVAAGKKETRATAKHVRGLVKEAYSAVRRGRGTTMQTLLATDVFVVGPEATDLHRSRGDAVVAATRRFDTTKRHRFRSRGLVAASSPSGKSAWIADRIDIDRKRYTLAAVLTEIDDIWYVVAVQLARVDRGKNAGTLPALPGGAKAGPSEVLDLVRAGAADPAQFLTQLGKHRQAIYLGPGKRDYARGAKRIRRLWRKRKLAKRPLAIEGELRAGVTPDGALAWVSANIGAGKAEPERVFWIYERTSEGWRLVLMQSARPKG